MFGMSCISDDNNLDRVQYKPPERDGRWEGDRDFEEMSQSGTSHCDQSSTDDCNNRWSDNRPSEHASHGRVKLTSSSSSSRGVPAGREGIDGGSATQIRKKEPRKYESFLTALDGGREGHVTVACFFSRKYRELVACNRVNRMSQIEFVNHPKHCAVTILWSKKKKKSVTRHVCSGSKCLKAYSLN
jgi:hypothetical protein